MKERWFDRLAWVLLVVLSVVMFVIGGVSVWFVDDPFPYAARVLITTFALGMTVLGSTVAATAFRQGRRWAWFAMWTYPAFFALHVAMLGTVVPDAGFAILAAVPMLLTGRRVFAPVRAEKRGGTAASYSATK